jgi:hypothetical protein
MYKYMTLSCEDVDDTMPLEGTQWDKKCGFLAAFPAKLHNRGESFRGWNFATRLYKNKSMTAK